MEELSQWRRKVQPKTRPPLLSIDAFRQSNQGLIVPNSTSPNTNIRHKLSKALQSQTNPLSPTTPPFATSQWNSTSPETRCTPPANVPQMVQAVMTQLLCNPTQTLPASFNHLILYIMESHGGLETRIALLETQLKVARKESARPQSNPKESRNGLLPKLASYGKHAVQLQRNLVDTKKLATKHTSPARPRHQSRGRDRQTVYEFLRSSRNRIPEKRVSSTPALESAKMIPRHPVLDLATPTLRISRGSSLSSASTFSTNYDSISQDGSDTIDTAADGDLAACRQLAELLVRRRGVEIEIALKRVTDAFFGVTGHEILETGHDSSPSHVVSTTPLPSRTSVDVDRQVSKRELTCSAENAAQGGSQPKNKEDHACKHRRPFSFDVGDDNLSHFSIALKNVARSDTSSSSQSSGEAFCLEPEVPKTVLKENSTLKVAQRVVSSKERGETSSDQQMGSVSCSRIPSPASGPQNARRRRKTSSSSSATTVCHSSLPAPAQGTGMQKHVKDLRGLSKPHGNGSSSSTNGSGKNSHTVSTG